MQRAGASLCDPGMAACLFWALCTVSDGLRDSELTGQLCSGGSEGVTCDCYLEGQGCSPDMGLELATGTWAACALHVCTCSEGARCWDHPHLLSGKLRLYTGGCWSEDLNSGLCDSGIQVGKQAPERSVGLSVLSLGLSFPIRAVGVE